VSIAIFNDTSKVRFATEKDLESVLEIERLSFPQPWDYAYLKDALDNLFLVYEEEDVLGYLIAVCCYNGIKAEIMKIAVNPTHRRRGIGKALIKTIIDILKEMQVKEVELDVKVLKKNAIKLYEKFGFRLLMVRTPNADNDAYAAMRLKLSDS
jgi:ribosomal-protein-alanine N-acetyltransferase